MTGVVIGGGTLALTTTTDIIVSGVAYRGSTLNFITGLIVGPGITLNLSAATVTSGSATATIIGNFSVVNGTGSYTYTLPSNPGTLFGINGTSLTLLVSNLSAGSDPITAQADNGAGSVVTRGFIITVFPNPASAPSLNFSNGTLNSQLLMVVM